MAGGSDELQDSRETTSDAPERRGFSALWLRVVQGATVCGVKRLSESRAKQRVLSEARLQTVALGGPRLMLPGSGGGGAAPLRPYPQPSRSALTLPAEVGEGGMEVQRGEEGRC